MLKIDPLHKGANPADMDGWHEYAPAIRYHQQGSYSAMVSPGFWKYHEGARLVRNVADFESAVSRMASANVQFKLVETWNEWHEGSGVEPAQQIVHDDDAAGQQFQPVAASYGNTYLNILGKYFGGTTNQAPAANAGADQTILVPAN